MRALVPFLCCLALLAGQIHAQEPVPTRSDSLDALPGLLNRSRARGIDLRFNLINGGPMATPAENPGQSGGTLWSLENMVFKVKVPLAFKPRFIFLLGYTYRPETYHFSGPAPPGSADEPVFEQMDRRRLKRNVYSLYAMRALPRGRYLAFRAGAAFSGDYDSWMNFEGRYGIYRVAATYGFKRGQDLEYGFGLVFTHNFRRTWAVPFFIYHRNFGPRWGLESVFPLYINGRYNLNERTLLLFGGRFSGSNYSIDLEDPRSGQEQLYHLGHTEFMLGASLERHLVPWVWLNVQAGYQFNLPTHFRGVGEGVPSYEMVPDGAPYLSVGLFLSPARRARR